MVHRVCCPFLLLNLQFTANSVNFPAKISLQPQPCSHLTISCVVISIRCSLGPCCCGDADLLLCGTGLFEGTGLAGGGSERLASSKGAKLHCAFLRSLLYNVFLGRRDIQPARTPQVLLTETRHSGSLLTNFALTMRSAILL